MSSTPTRRTAMLVGVGALIAGIVGAGLLVARSQGAQPNDDRAESVQTVAEPAESAGIEGAPDVVPSAEPEAVAEADVRVRFQPNVPGAEVFDGDDTLGPADEPLSLPRSNDVRKLTVRLDGYEDREVEITPKGDLLVPVELKKRKIVAGGAKVPLPQPPPPTTPPPAAPPPTSGGPSSEELEW